MSTTATATLNESSGTLKLRADEKKESEYRWTHLLPAFPKDEHYPPLTPFEHVDPGHRALQHPNPRQFLANAKVSQLTPPIGEEVRGVNLATLSNDEKDELALEVCENVTRFERYSDSVGDGRSQSARFSYSAISRTSSKGDQTFGLTGVSDMSISRRTRLTSP